MRVASLVNGIPVQLPPERWAHIVLRHPELDGRQDELMQAVEHPVVVVNGTHGALLAVRPLADRWIVVAYREVNHADGFVITGYVTKRSPTRLRGDAQ